MTTLKPPTRRFRRWAQRREKKKKKKNEPPLDLVDANVDETRVGVSGVSLGGMYAWLAAAAAPETIAAAAPLIGAQDFGWALRNERWRARVDSLPPALFEAAKRDERETLGDERTSVRARSPRNSSSACTTPSVPA